MKFPQKVDHNTDLVRLNTFDLLYVKEDIKFVTGLRSWLGCYSHWGHHLAGLMSHPKLAIPIKWSQLDYNTVDID
jgi:hypothetical protein